MLNTFGGRRYKVEKLNNNGCHRIVDIKSHKATPVDRLAGNMDFLYDMFTFDRAIFNSTCESLIDSCGSHIN